jgi:hypothetical protein
MASSALPAQTGSAELAIELMQPPWKEVFSDEAAAPATAEPAHAGVVIGVPS